MKTLSLSEAKMKISRLVDIVSSQDEEIMITKNGLPAAYIISPYDYEGYKETADIRYNDELMAEIKKGLEDLRKNNVKLYTLEELFDNSNTREITME